MLQGLGLLWTGHFTISPVVPACGLRLLLSYPLGTTFGRCLKQDTFISSCVPRVLQQEQSNRRSGFPGRKFSGKFHRQLKASLPLNVDANDSGVDRAARGGSESWVPPQPNFGSNSLAGPRACHLSPKMHREQQLLLLHTEVRRESLFYLGHWQLSTYWLWASVIERC